MPFDIPRQVSLEAAAVIAAFERQSSVVNLAGNAVLTLTFTNVDQHPLLDVFCFADQAITIRVSVQGPGGAAYRVRAGGDWVTVASELFQILATRIAGTQMQVTFTNGATATTVFEVGVYMRAIA